MHTGPEEDGIEITEPYPLQGELKARIFHSKKKRGESFRVEILESTQDGHFSVCKFRVLGLEMMIVEPPKVRDMIVVFSTEGTMVLETFLYEDYHEGDRTMKVAALYTHEVEKGKGEDFVPPYRAFAVRLREFYELRGVKVGRQRKLG